jgi:hypothetical protein
LLSISKISLAIKAHQVNCASLLKINAWVNLFKRLLKDLYTSKSDYCPNKTSHQKRSLKRPSYKNKAIIPQCCIWREMRAYIKGHLHVYVLHFIVKLGTTQVTKIISSLSPHLEHRKLSPGSKGE